MSLKKSFRNKNDVRLSIPDFFWGKAVFITGATGFMGKVLVEKLLRSCPGISKIYFLMRPKKGKTLEERVAEMIALPLFVKLKRENNKAFQKLVPLQGDAREIGLGLSEEDKKILIQEVSIVFHVAACVRFDDSLKQAILLNTRGTCEALKLAKQMKNIEVFLHTSTTYCNTHKEVIEEDLYPPPTNWKTMIKLAENLDEETLEVFGTKIVGAFPNTYTYSKALAEHVVNTFREDVPVVIFRPSIVISSYLEPMPGWIDNFNGPVGLFVASGKGIVNSVYSDPKISADYVPVDVAVRAMIVTAWERATWKPEEKKTRVYNASSYGIKSITQAELVDVALYVVKRVPLNDMLWFPHGGVTKCKFMHYLRVALFHILPALIVDTALKLRNKKPMLMKIQRKIFVANMALSYFLTKQWSFKNDKLFTIESRMLEEDKPAFSYRVEEVDEIEFFINSAFGVREYLLKEDNTGLPEAKKHSDRMYKIDKVVRTLFLCLFGYLAYRWQVLPTIRGWLFYILGIIYTVFSSI